MTVASHSLITEQSIINDFLSQIAHHFRNFKRHETRIRKALELARYAHHDQVRRYEKIPFLSHPTAVALNLAKQFQDIELIEAALLHDAVEDNDEIDIAQIYNEFGPNVWLLVDAVSDNTLNFYADPKAVCHDKIEKILAGGMQDIRVLLLKLADRDHNLITLIGLKPEKQIRMTFETQAIYEPLKEILYCNPQDICIDKATTALHTYILEQQIDSAASFKQNLFGQMYHNFDSETFNLAYQNTDTIIWEVEDKERFEELLTNEVFKEYIQIDSLRTDWTNFKAKFNFKKWYLITKRPTSKFKIYNLVK